MCDIELESCSVWRETPRTARKPHCCDGCNVDIRPCDAYLDHFSHFDHEAHGERLCFACWLTREQFADHHGARCNPSYLWEALANCISDNGDNDLEGWRPLLAAMKARHRTSSAGRRQLRRGWNERRERLRRKVLALDGFGGSP